MRAPAGHSWTARSLAAMGAFLALALLTSGCTLLASDGVEMVVVTNRDVQPVDTFLRITTEGGIPVFNEGIFLEQRGSREYVVVLTGGIHDVRITTTNGISEFLRIDIPEKGDTRIDVTLFRGRATIATTTN